MRAYRILPWASGWGAALLCVVAIGLAFTPFGADPAPNTVPTANDGATDAAPASPHLVGRADARDAQSVEDNTATAEDVIGRVDVFAPTDEDVAAFEDGDFDHIRDGAPLTVDHPLVAPVIVVQEFYTGELMEHPLVVGTAVGMNELGEIVLLVLAKEDITDLPTSLGGVPVTVFVTGEFFSSKGKPGGTPGGGGGGDTSIDRTARFDRPVPIGISTGHPDITAGTIGCRVTDVTTGGTSVWALSNNHVYANQNDASNGDAVIQPGKFDGGKSHADDIGNLADFYPIVFTNNASNTMDAAIALSSTAKLGNSTPSDGYGTPKSATASASINLRVRKYGRTTGQKNGRVSGINATVLVGYGGGRAARFVNQIVITPGSFSAGGDSGSLIVVQKGGNADKPVALLFAGSSSSTIGSPIDAILTEFGVTVDGD